MSQKVIIDCDPGIDDAVALAALVSSAAFDLLAVTITHGNVSLKRTTQNALDWLSFLGSEVPVFKGCAKPFLAPMIAADDIHGDDGIGSVELPKSGRAPETTPAPSVLVQYANEQPGAITLLATGPLTNIATALQLDASLLTKFKQVVIMGGSTGDGNTTKAAEFNILADPHAAQVVFATGAPITLIGLNATHQVIANPGRLASLRALRTKVGEPLAQMMEFYKIAYSRQYGWDGAAIHDLCTAAFVVRPEAFKTEQMNVNVVLTEGPEFGRTICSTLGQPNNVAIVTEIEANQVFDFLEQALLEALRRNEPQEIR